jgi:hypothetical protein
MSTINEEITISIVVEGPYDKGLPAQVVVPFKVFKEDQKFKAVPLLAYAERKQAGLPEVIAFSFVDQCIVTERSLSEDTLEVIKNMIQELILQDVID